MTWDAVWKALVVLVTGLGGLWYVLREALASFGRVTENRIAEAHRLATERTLTNLKGEIDVRLTHLESALQHQNLLRLKLAEIELEGLRTCWQRAASARHYLNGLRPVDCGTDRGALGERRVALGKAHNELLAAMAEFEPFLEVPIVELLEAVRRIASLEISQSLHEVFEIRWWAQGTENRQTSDDIAKTLRDAIRIRIAVLRQFAGGQSS